VGWGEEVVREEGSGKGGESGGVRGICSCWWGVGINTAMLEA
jgi:hypothetical protein